MAGSAERPPRPPNRLRLDVDLWWITTTVFRLLPLFSLSTRFFFFLLFLFVKLFFSLASADGLLEREREPVEKEFVNNDNQTRTIDSLRPTDEK